MGRRGIAPVFGSVEFPFVNQLGWLDNYSLFSGYGIQL